MDARTPWRVVEEFEQAIAAYCGSRFAVATDSATNALYLCFVRARPTSNGLIWLPRYTYVGVVRAALNAGLSVKFSAEAWVGEYHINVGTRSITDAARWLRRDMHSPCAWATCVSFHAFKHLPIGRGGAVLCDNEEDAQWFRRASYDGRDRTKPISEQKSFQFGIHAYMPPEAAARGLLLMTNLPDKNDPLPGTYPNLAEVQWT